MSIQVREYSRTWVVVEIGHIRNYSCVHVLFSAIRSATTYDAKKVHFAITYKLTKYKVTDISATYMNESKNSITIDNR